MKTLNELQALIIEWAKDKDLIHWKNAPKQRLKLIEECGELASAILKNDISEQKDAIGDIFVVLVIFAEQLGNNINLEKCVKEEYSYNLSLAINYLINNSTFESQIADCFDTLHSISIKLKLDLTECVNLAYNEIKDRKGNTVNGTFIKSNEQK